MAGDWIKMRGNLWDDPRIGKMVDATDSSEAAVVGALYWLWAIADQHSEDGFMSGLSLRQIDRKTGVVGFGKALLDIGWINEGPDGIAIIRFDEHNGVSAKKRAQTAKRVANHKALTSVSLPEVEENQDSYDNANADSVTSALAERYLEKRREEKILKPKQDKSCLSAEPPDYALENSDEPETTDTGNPIPNVPHAEIIEAYNEILATQGLTAVKLKLWDKSERAKWLRTRWREDPGRQNIDWWRGFFQYVSRSDFLMGRVRSDRPWQADLGWLLKRENFVKVLEGKYDA